MKGLIVGFGGFARGAHYPIMKQFCESIDVVDVVEPVGYDVRYLGSEIPSEGEYDVALVASPPVYHAEHTIKALGVARRVLCEKPPAMSAAEVEQMLDAARRNGASLLFGFNNIYRPSWQRFRQLVVDAYSAHGNWEGCGFALRWLRKDGIPAPEWFKRKSMGGGVLLDLGSHMLSLVLSCVGESLTNVPVISATLLQLTGELGDADYSAHFLLGDSEKVSNAGAPFVDVHVAWKIPDYAVIPTLDLNSDPPISIGYGDDCTYKVDELRIVIFYFPTQPFSYLYAALDWGTYAISTSEPSPTSSLPRPKLLEICHDDNSYAHEWSKLLQMGEGEVDRMGLWVQRILDEVRERAVVG